MEDLVFNATRNMTPDQLLHTWLGCDIAMQSAVDNRVLIAKLYGFDAYSLVVQDSDNVMSIVNRRDITAVWQPTLAELEATTDKED